MLYLLGRGPWLAILCAISIASSFAGETDALACEPLPAYRIKIVESDLPRCASRLETESYSDAPGFGLNDTCEGLKLECPGCSTEVDRRFGADGIFLIVPGPTEATTERVTVMWTRNPALDPNAGSIEVDITLNDRDGCSGCLCSSPHPVEGRVSSSSLVLMLLLLLPLGLRRPR